MRYFLYITPYFPPLGRVGALRPLKFARHLHEMGWSPIVLCDWWVSAGSTPESLAALPEDLMISRTYSHRATGYLPPESVGDDQADQPRWREPPSMSSSPQQRLGRLFAPLLNPELIPLGEHSVHILHGLRAARTLLKAYPTCEAIMVNADPYAALLVGALLQRETGLPLIQDLRDPWTVCALRRSRRPAPIRAFVDWLERRAFTPAARIIVNTDCAREDYQRHYQGRLPGERFVTIRNHGDPGLIDRGTHPGFDRFTLLFLGGFRRFVEGDTLLKLLAELKARGLGECVQLVITGSCPPESWRAAEKLGVSELIKLHRFVPYSEVGAIIERADLLVALSNQSPQRIPAKFYDYVMSDRPLLVLADSPELAKLTREAAGHYHRLDEVEEAAELVETLTTRGDPLAPYELRPQLREALSSQQASRRLAAILEEVTGAE